MNVDMRSLMLVFAALPLVGCTPPDDGSGAGGSGGGSTTSSTSTASGTGTTASTSTGAGGAGGGTTSECIPASGGGTVHAADDIESDTTWAADGSPHHITSTVRVEKGATLTIEPCATVIIDPGMGITVNGGLAAPGTATQPIAFDSSDAAKPFAYIRSFGSVSLDYVSITHGGATDINGWGVIDMRGAGGARQELLHVDHVSIDGSNGHGISLRAGAAFSADSNALTIKSAALQPIRTTPPLVHNLPSGSYTGNGKDEILVSAEDPISEDTTWTDRGVPYAIGDEPGASGDMRVGVAVAGPKVKWTVSPGVTVGLVPGGRILMSSSGNGVATGVIVADGTAAKPIVFTSLAPAPAAGDWVGLYFAAPDDGDSISNARIEYAGGPSGAISFHCDPKGGLNEAEDAAILVFGQPSAGFVRSSTIADSAGYGVDRGWRGDLIDFIADNKFIDLAKCKESYPRELDGGCPAMVPCD